MAAATRLQYWYWTWFSKPAADRQLYRQVERVRPARIVEFGFNSAERTTRLVRIAQRFAPGPVHYFGVDPFESRTTGDGITLKAAYRLLSELGAKSQFFPGDPAAMVPLVANRLLRSDLILVAPWVDQAKLQGAWNFWPRMMHEKSIVALWNVSRQLYEFEKYEAILRRADVAAGSARRAA